MPRIDARLGFHNIAKYNYFPGWHQPATMFELLINKDRWDDLDEVAQNQIEIACMANITDNFAEGEATNFEAMQDNVENNGVTIKQWSPEMLAPLKVHGLRLPQSWQLKMRSSRKSGTTFRSSAQATRSGTKTSTCRVRATKSATLIASVIVGHKIACRGSRPGILRDSCRHPELGWQGDLDGEA